MKKIECRNIFQQGFIEVIPTSFKGNTMIIYGLVEKLTNFLVKILLYFEIALHIDRFEVFLFLIQFIIFSLQQSPPPHFY